MSPRRPMAIPRPSRKAVRAIRSQSRSDVITRAGEQIITLDRYSAGVRGAAAKDRAGNGREGHGFA